MTLSSQTTGADHKPAPDLQVQLFGPFAVRVEGVALPPLHARKGSWLLALLILKQERPVDRAWLAATLWPDSDHRESLKNLRNNLSDLRHALGGQKYRLYAPTPGTVRLDLSGVEIDVSDFDACIKRGDPASLVEAVTLYRGTLLEGCGEEWVVLERQQRLHAYVEALETLARFELEAAGAATAARRLRTCIGLDPLRESAQCALMTALAAAGDYAGVTQVYRAFRLHLHEHLRAQPAAETTALYQTIRVRARQVAAGGAALPPAAGARQLSERGADSTPQESEDLPVGRKALHNLPLPSTSFIGREKERAELNGLLAQTRLLTLIGAGGSGKTRLMLEVAGDLAGVYPDGVWLVELASLSDPALVIPTVAAVFDIREQSETPLLQTLVTALQPKTLLLLLDNCEHLLAPCAELAVALLRTGPSVQLLATSRERLGIAGEQVYRVPSLSLPDLNVGLSVESLERYEAVQLFVARARLIRSDFRVSPQNAAAVAGVCHRLDGLPLALELAAARVRSLSVEDLLRRLDDRFQLLTGGDRSALPRQQTLRGLMDWSYDLLSAPEKQLLQRLSVFAGGWTLDAAEQVCGSKDESGRSQEKDEGGRMKDEEDNPGGSSFILYPSSFILDLLTSLVDKSLVIAEERDGSVRYRLLETLRQYARDRLVESAEADTVRRRHQDYFLALAEKAEPELMGAEQAHWLGILEAEHDNLRQALTFSLEAREGDESASRLGAALSRFWWIRGHLSEGREYLMAVLGRHGSQEPTRVRAVAANGAGVLAYLQGDYAVARSRYEESLAIYRELGNRVGIANALGNLGTMASRQGDYAAACSLYEESLTIKRELGEKQGVAQCLCNLGIVACEQGNHMAARSLLEESLAIQRELANRQGIALVLNNLGSVAKQQGGYMTARGLYEESLALRRELGDKQGAAYSLISLGLVAQELRDFVSARSLMEESLAILRGLGDRSGIANSLLNLGNVACTQGDFATARSLYKESLAIVRELGDKRGIVLSLEAYAALAHNELQSERAVGLWGAAAILREAIGSPLPPDEREKYYRQIEHMRMVIGANGFDTVWMEGRTMAAEKAIAFALEANST